GNEYSGTIGKKITASRWKGIEYIRKFFVPQNPNTVLQQEHRALFTGAVDSWHTLTSEQKDAYELMAVKMTGMNLYVKRWLEAARNQTPLPVPQPLAVQVTDAEGYALQGVVVKFKRRSKLIREIKTGANGRASLVLPLEDAPYDVETSADGYTVQRMVDLTPSAAGTVSLTVTPVAPPVQA
ncbi:MAG: hypothetical protein V1934_04440, partial [Methanobacteriota archaeon]